MHLLVVICDHGIKDNIALLVRAAARSVALWEDDALKEGRRDDAASIILPPIACVAVPAVK
jgi:hypothetical protein